MVLIRTSCWGIYCCDFFQIPLADGLYRCSYIAFGTGKLFFHVQ